MCAHSLVHECAKTCCTKQFDVSPINHDGRLKREKKLNSISDEGRRAQGRGISSTPRKTHKKTFCIVGVGASAGGLEAFQQLLEKLPVDTGMAFVVVQHLDPSHESALSDILSRATSMPVLEASDRIVVKPNHVYVMPPDVEMTMKGWSLRHQSRKQAVGVPHSIDQFFESLAENHQQHAIGVILSGTANDGTLGLEAIKGEGGITFAQDASAKFDEMPRNAIAAGCVDFVLAPEGIAQELERIAKHPYVEVPLNVFSAGQERTAEVSEQGSVKENKNQKPHLSPGKESAARKILLLLRNRCGVDFSLYKPATIQRRIARRMVLKRVKTVEDYRNFLQENEKELDALYSDLLISVTSFFRNPEAFEALQREVFPKLIRTKRPDENLRVWVLGCSTGQEAYSIAMAYLECIENVPRAPRLQMFATDLNEAVLEKARKGFYAKALVQDVSPERLRRFFVEEEAGYRVNKSLRDLCVFAQQNLLSDPPFSRMDLISCRNLLIYIEPALQNKVLPNFHYALNPHGFLFLGASESIGPFGNLFEAVNKKMRIFARKTGSTPKFSLPQSESSAPKGKPEVAKRLLGLTAAGEATTQREADRVTGQRFAPPGVLINSELQILQFRGATGPYLEPSAGKASLDLMKMVSPSLMLPLRNTIDKAKKQGITARTENISLGPETMARRINLEVIPLKNLKERSYLIFFEEAEEKNKDKTRITKQKKGKSATKDSESAGLRRRCNELERELAETRDYLKSMQEQFEAANEELQAANEEATSANEELQSMNEELETSKEELESTNEELTTVNDEMANRNQELNQLNSDLNNLHASIQTPILVLGRDLTIRRFTPLAQKVFNLLASDVGRPLNGIRHNLDFTELETFIDETISSITPHEREIRDRDGNWYVLRVRPYLTLDNKIDGVVLMLMDINVLKQTERRIEEALDFANAVIEAVPPLIILEPDLRVRTANQSFYQTFKVSAEKTERRLIYELGNGQWNIPALRQLLEEILPRGKAFHQYEVTHDFEVLGRRTMLISGCKVDSMHAIVLSLEDITTRKQAEGVLSDRREKLEQLVAERTSKLNETIGELLHFSYTITHDMRAPLRAMVGYADMVLTEETTLGETGRTYLARISESAVRLDELITDALDYAKLSQEAFELRSISIEPLLRGMLRSYPHLESSGAKISIAEQMPAVLANEAGLTQCFSNLLNNAVKFVPPGQAPEIRIWAEERKSSPEAQESVLREPQSVVRFWVEDNGIGIPEDQLSKIFVMFQRLDVRREGTGIGLALVKKAAERMSGTVGVESQVGKGSRFWLEFKKATPVNESK